MPFEVALILAFAILAATAVGMSVLVTSRRQKDKEEELKRAASARGWQFEARVERGYRIQKWTGTTDGVPWIAESAMHVSGGSHNRRRVHFGRWHGTFNPGINAPIAAMGVPKGKEVISTQLADGQSWVAKLAQKAVGFAFDKAIDTYFGEAIGKGVDAGAMHRVDGQRIPGFIVMAADKDEGARILSQGFEKALSDASNDRASVFSHDDRPWILLRPNGISLARMHKLRDVAELDGFVRAGVALTLAFTFGRRSLS